MSSWVRTTETTGNRPGTVLCPARGTRRQLMNTPDAPHRSFRQLRRFTTLGLSLWMAVALLAVPPAWAKTVAKGEKALAAGKWTEAADAFAAVAEKDATDRRAILGLAEAARKGKLADHLATATELLAGLRESNPKDVDLAIATGETFLAKGLVSGASDPDGLRYALADAKSAFEEALAVDPKNEAAHVGAAQVAFQGAEFDQALKILDAFLATKPEKPGRALYWQGKVYYLRANDAFRAAGSKFPLTGDVRALYVKAKGAFEASTLKDPTNFDAHMQLAYAAQIMGDQPTASTAYEKALALEPTSDLPLKGFSALYAHTPKKYVETLNRLAKTYSSNAVVFYHLGYHHLRAKQWGEAVPLFTKSINLASNDAFKAEANFYLGWCYDQTNQKDKAIKCFHATLKANPEHPQAPLRLERYIMADLASSGGGALDLASGERALKAYKKLTAMAPKNVDIRNNIGLILRDAYERNGQSSKYEPLLKAGTKFYTEASELIGEWNSDMEESVPFATRYGHAQVISDTGLMYQFYKPTRDYKRAEMYYSRALEFSSDGYYDAFNNLSKIYTEQKKWEDLYDLCAACEEALMANEKGAPHTVGRAQAKSIMKRLVAEGKVEGE